VRASLASLTVRAACLALAALSALPVAKPAYWSHLTAPHTPSWSATWIWARSDKSRTRKQSDILWRLLHDALPLGIHTQRWLPRSGPCPWGCTVLEDAAHLFCHCPTVRPVWHEMLDRWRRVSKLSWPLTPHLVAFGRPPRHAISNVTRALLPQWDRLHAATVQAIWNLRCKTVMDGAPKPSVPALVAASLSLTVPA
jgi:hypothetical protein